MRPVFAGMLCVGWTPGDRTVGQHCIPFYHGDLCVANILEDGELVMCGAPATAENRQGQTFCREHRTKRQRPAGIRP